MAPDPTDIDGDLEAQARRAALLEEGRAIIGEVRSLLVRLEDDVLGELAKPEQAEKRARRRSRRSAAPELPEPTKKLRWMLELFPLRRESMRVQELTIRAWRKQHGAEGDPPLALDKDPVYGHVRDLLRRAKAGGYVEQPRHGDYRLTEAAERLLRPPVKRSPKGEEGSS